ncbi:hypothetical protein M011DRAFT_77360 [Sporormia fimetaria CBS 119925]|uniref:Uncharacterized protein n=1 Tax=Sporormia fimetaria CBS 119925 TaxID=1340428 RepID=A0A6A6VAH4_9PLEO|nr:hypothetical protein M011DRAFT_77360 [Sporormia fimetaria CBS 119925]
MLAQQPRDMTDASLQMFDQILDTTESIRSMAKGKDGKFGFIGRVQWAVFQNPEITISRAALEAYKSNMSLMLATLNTTEKATRRMYCSSRLRIWRLLITDNVVLESLRLEHRASLIDVDEVVRLNKRGVRDQEHAEIDSGLPDTTGGASEHISKKGVTPPPRTSTDPFIDSARDEIQTIRTSLSRSSTFNSDIIHDQVSRHNKSISLLVTADHNRLSQRRSISIARTPTERLLPNHTALPGNIPQL